MHAVDRLLCSSLDKYVQHALHALTDTPTKAIGIDAVFLSIFRSSGLAWAEFALFRYGLDSSMPTFQY